MRKSPSAYWKESKLPDDDVTPEPTEPVETFDAEYVATLRRENAERRAAARDAEEALTATRTSLDLAHARLLVLEVADATRDALADPSDLLANVDPTTLVGEDGTPDAEKIKAATAELLGRKPHLARPTKPTGNVDQGARPPSAPVFDFAGALRRAAT